MKTSLKLTELRNDTYWTSRSNTLELIELSCMKEKDFQNLLWS